MKRSHWDYTITPPGGGTPATWRPSLDFDSGEKIRRLARTRASHAAPGTVIMVRRDGRDQEGWYTSDEHRLVRRTARVHP